MLGRVIERASAQTLDAFFRTRIFDPLGMEDTFYVVPPDKHDRVVTQHGRDAGGARSERPNAAPTLQSAVRGDGGLFSTARDYATFLQVFLNGGRHGSVRLASDRTIKLMISNQTASSGSRVTGGEPASLAVSIGAARTGAGLAFRSNRRP